MSVPLEQTFRGCPTLLAYESFDADVTLRNVLQSTRLQSQIAYESFTRDVKLFGIPYPGEFATIKLTYNLVMFVFLGKAYIFDGVKVLEFGSPINTIYPFVSVQDSKIFAGGGMREDRTIEEDVYGYGAESYFMTADRDYLVVVVPTDVVYILDAEGNVVQTTKQLSVVPLLMNWKLTSRKPFIAIVQRLL